MKAILAGYPRDTVRPASTAEDYWWERAMKWTQVAAVTTWPPEVQDRLPWRYRARVLSCFSLLNEARAEQ